MLTSMSAWPLHVMPMLPAPTMTVTLCVPVMTVTVVMVSPVKIIMNATRIHAIQTLHAPTCQVIFYFHYGMYSMYKFCTRFYFIFVQFEPFLY